MDNLRLFVSLLLFVAFIFFLVFFFPCEIVLQHIQMLKKYTCFHYCNLKNEIRKRKKTYIAQNYNLNVPRS